MDQVRTTNEPARNWEMRMAQGEEQSPRRTYRLSTSTVRLQALRQEADFHGEISHPPPCFGKGCTCFLNRCGIVFLICDRHIPKWITRSRVKCTTVLVCTSESSFWESIMLRNFIMNWCLRISVSYLDTRTRYGQNLSWRFGNCLSIPLLGLHRQPRVTVTIFAHTAGNSHSNRGKHNTVSSQDAPC